MDDKAVRERHDALPVADTLAHTVVVPIGAAEAWTVFAEELDSWWPRDYTWSGDVLVKIGIESGAGGLCFERGPDNFRCDWGRVLTWEPGVQLVLAWQIGAHREPVPDVRKASTVTVAFAPESTGCRIALEHRDFERVGVGAAAYRAAMNGREGWPRILSRFADACQAVSRENMSG